MKWINGELDVISIITILSFMMSLYMIWHIIDTKAQVNEMINDVRELRMMAR